MKNPSTLKMPAKRSAGALAVATLIGVAIGGYVIYMKSSATAIEAKLQYSYAMQTASPENTKTVSIFENEAVLLLAVAGNNEYS